MSSTSIDPGKSFSERVAQATLELFGDQPVALAVRQACHEFDRQRESIEQGRGIDLLTIAIVGAKGQGKTWLARQMILQSTVRDKLRSGDLSSDATTKLVWVGPRSPETLQAGAEEFWFCPSEEMVDLGRPYMVLDTPGLTDADRSAAEIARQALTLAPIKLLVIARDQMRSAVNMHIARQIAGSVVVPVITAIDPREMQGDAQRGLDKDLSQLREHLENSAPQSQWLKPVLIPDFDVSCGEVVIGKQAIAELTQRISEQPLDQLAMSRNKQQRLSAAQDRFRNQVSQMIANELPQLTSAVRRLQEEAERLPQEVILSMLGSPVVLQTGVRSRLRAQMITDTSPIWFPYRTLLSTLHLTQGAWDRVLLALTGSVPSLFGSLAALARNVHQTRQLQWELQEGVRDRLHRQINDRLQPLCEQFYRVITRLQNRSEHAEGNSASASVRLAGVEELQTRSREIFEATLAEHAHWRGGLQLLGLIGTAIFWAFMAGPIVSLYRSYIGASYLAIVEQRTELEAFPHPSPALLITSMLLSALPLLIYSMIVLTLFLRRGKIEGVANKIQQRHLQVIEQLQASGVVRLYFENRLLDQAHFLIHLDAGPGGNFRGN